MFIRDISEKFIFWNVQISKFEKSELGKFIPSFPFKYVITSTNTLLVVIKSEITSYIKENVSYILIFQTFFI